MYRDRSQIQVWSQVSAGSHLGKAFFPLMTWEDRETKPPRVPESHSLTLGPSSCSVGQICPFSPQFPHTSQNWSTQLLHANGTLQQGGDNVSLHLYLKSSEHRQGPFWKAEFMAELTNSAIASLVHSSLSPRPRARAPTSSPALCLPGTLQRENSWANTKHFSQLII